MRIYNYESFAGGREGGVSSLSIVEGETAIVPFASVNTGEYSDCCNTSETIVPMSQLLAQLLLLSQQHCFT